MTFLLECRRALRGVLSRPGFTALVLAALGLGIGLNTAIFSLVHSVLLRSLPYREPERLVRVWESRPRMGPNAADIAAFSMDHYRAWRESNDVFESMAVYQDRSFNLTGGAEPVRVEGQAVSPVLFPMLGVEPRLGRVFTSDEEIPGRERVAILSHGLWQRQFGSDPSAAGSTIRLDGRPYVVVGVMPPEFRFPDPRTELWVPLPAAAPPPLPPGAMRIELVPLVARLAHGVTIEEAEEAARAFLEHYRRGSAAPPELEREVRIHLTSLRDQLVRPIRPALLVLFGAAFFVLLIVCANVANLFAARAQRREAELAIRAAMGASRSRIARQLLLESLVYALAGGALAILVARLALGLVQALLPSGSALLDGAGLHAEVLGFNLAVALLTAVLVGVLPAHRASTVDVVSGLKGMRGSLPRGHRARRALAVAEVALALVLSVGAGILLRSFLELARTDPGYEPERVLSFRVLLPEAKYPDGDSRRAFFDRLRERLSALPGVTAAGLVSTFPVDPERMMTHVRIEGRPLETDPARMPHARIRVTSPGFFRALSIPLVSGRDFDERDGPRAEPVVLINESLSRRELEGEIALDRSIQRMGRIVGVARDFRQEGLDRDPEPEIYLDYRQVPDTLAEALSRMGVVVRHEPNAPAVLDSVKAVVQELDSELPLADVRSMEARLDETVARPRLYAFLLGFFAAIALVIAATGVGSVVSYQAAERTRENGLRMALGATSLQILARTLGHGLRILIPGLAIGLGGSYFLGRSLSSALFSVGPIDPWTVLVVSLVLAAAVLLSSALPARRAARMDPVKALRYE